MCLVPCLFLSYQWLLVIQLGAACSLTNIRTYVRYAALNICWVKMCTVACLFLSYQWLLVIQLGGAACSLTNIRTYVRYAGHYI